MKRIFAIALSLGTLAAVAGGAEAGTQCGPRDQIVKVLGGRYHENRQAIGLATGMKSVVELFVSEQGTWTMTVTDTSGTTCIVGAGEAWQSEPKVLAGLES